MFGIDVIKNATLSATKIKAKFPYSEQIKLNELLLTNNTRIAAYPFLLTEKETDFMLWNESSNPFQLGFLHD